MLTADEVLKLGLITNYSGNSPVIRGASVNLTIGQIYDTCGNTISGKYILQPGEMVQVVSRERFNLSKSVSALISYKTEMTHEGVWALTVGIVDPGWNGPISTTLLNFGKNPYPIENDEEFLRASFFLHNNVKDGMLVKCNGLADYYRNVRLRAVSKFHSKFLDIDALHTKAGEYAAMRMRSDALKWAGIVALIFALSQIFVAITTMIIPRYLDENFTQRYDAMKSNQIKDSNIMLEIDALRREIDILKSASD